MNRDELAQHLRGGLFTSAMMGILNGRTLARLGNHASMVQLGALFTEDTTHLSKDPRFVYTREEEKYAQLLRQEIEPIRESLGAVPVSWNTAPGDAISAIRFAAAADMAGADMYELNFNGGYGKIIKRNTIRAMAMAQNHETLLGWIREVIQRSDLPICVKFFTGMHGVDFTALAEMLSGIGLFALHLNVRSLKELRPNYDVVAEVRPCFDGLLLCSGRVTTAEHAKRLFKAGADCVGVAKGLVDDAFLISKLSVQLGGRAAAAQPEGEMEAVEVDEDDREYDASAPDEAIAL